jgi:uncharacterized protein
MNAPKASSGDADGLMKEVALSIAALLVCACASSPPVDFFVLDAVVPAGVAASVPGDPLQVTRVHMPATLDRREIVREDAPNKLTISSQKRWGAPLPDMTQRVLSQNLMLRLPAGRVVLPDQPAPDRTSSISVDILQFGADASGTIVLDGSWSVVPSGTEAARASHRFQLSQRAIRDDYAEQARVMSVLLAQLADAIAHQMSVPHAN